MLVFFKNAIGQLIKDLILSRTDFKVFMIGKLSVSFSTKSKIEKSIH